jgi:hypothetical protein
VHKRTIPLALAAIAGFIPILSSLFSTPGDAFQVQVTDRLEQWMIIIAGFALLLGVVHVFQVNLRKIARRDAGWPYAVVLLVSLTTMAFLGLNQAMRRGMGWEWLPELSLAGGRTWFEWAQDATFTPLQATMFSLLAFYVASAAFRAFRARNVEASILLAAAMIVMLGVNPYGIALFSWVPAIGNAPGGAEFLPWLTNWVMNVPNAAAQRGIIIGAALGASAMSLRVLLGIERGHLGLGKGD